MSASSNDKSSWLHNWDPRWKFAAFTLLILSIAVERPGMRASPSLDRDFPPAFATLVVAALLTLSAKFSLADVMHRIRAAFWFLGALLIGLSLLYGSGEPTASEPATTPFLSTEGLHLALAIICRSLSALILVFPGFLTTPTDRALRTLRSFRVPTPLILILQFTQRYAVIFRERQKRCADAMALRGFQSRSQFASLKIWGQQIGTALNYSIDRSERVAGAMKLRGYSAQLAPLDDVSTRASDVLKFAAVIAGGSVLLYWRVFLV